MAGKMIDWRNRRGELAEMIGRRMCLAEIAGHFGCSASTASHAIKRHGFKLDHLNTRSLRIESLRRIHADPVISRRRIDALVAARRTQESRDRTSAATLRIVSLRAEATRYAAMTAFEKRLWRVETGRTSIRDVIWPEKKQHDYTLGGVSDYG